MEQMLLFFLNKFYFMFVLDFSSIKFLGKIQATLKILEGKKV
jgi:hypothetical protein